MMNETGKCWHEPIEHEQKLRIERGVWRAAPVDRTFAKCEERFAKNTIGKCE